MVRNFANIRMALAFCALTMGSASAASPTQDLQDYISWVTHTHPQNNLLRELQGSGLSDAQTLAESVHQDMIKKNGEAVVRLVNGMCQPMAQVDFLDSSDAAFFMIPQNQDKDFESGFVKIEAIGCLSHGTAEQALKIYFDPAFRRAVVPELTDSVVSNGLICEQTQKVPLIASATHSCISTTGHESGIIHATWVSLDQNVAGFDPIYFREGLITAIDSPSGPRIHVLIYARQKDKLAKVVHGMASSKLSKEQQAAFEELNRRLAQ